MDWDFKQLQEWDDKISEIALKHGLDWFPIHYEVCDYFSMIGHMAYHAKVITHFVVNGKPVQSML